jgi:6-pyruvoyltetrahydropterin/6-carboxytetrahydropterin synthase
MKLTRCYRFCASHRLHSSALSEAENEQVYGKCNNPFGHGHDYVLELTVAGQMEERTGRLSENWSFPTRLDTIRLQETKRNRFELRS